MGVFAGSNLRFLGDTLDRPYESNVPGHEPYPFFTYAPMPRVHGLTPYKAIKNIDADLLLDDENRRHSSLNHILYFARENGRVIAFIRCGSGLTSAPGGTHTCRHHFVLWPEMNAQVQLSYADGLLPHWREYQAGYRALLLGFRLNPTADSQPVSPTP